MPKYSQELALSGEFQVILISSFLLIFGALQIVYGARVVESKKQKQMLNKKGKHLWGWGSMT